MKRINRQTMRGEKLSVACANAPRSSREYAIGEYEFTGCYGISDAECATCGAWVYNDFVKRANEVLRERR